MKKIVFLVILSLLLLPSCGMRRARAVMDDVETYMQQAPDSAQRALLSLPRRSHYLPWQHARYCLLMSSALDRIGINVQDDSLARYAAEYYDHFGGPVKRFYAQYYLGRVHENRGDRQSAMDAFVKAESITSDRVPARFRCALEMHIGVIYTRIYETQKAIRAFEEAACYAQKSSWEENYYQAILNLVRVYINSGQYDEASRFLAKLSRYESEMTPQMLLSKKGCEIKLMEINHFPAHQIVHFGDSLIIQYAEERSLIPWEDLSHAYIRSGQSIKAFDAIKQYAEYNNIEKSSTYYGILSEVLDSLGNLRESLTAYKRYIEISDSLDLVIFGQDTKFLKERYALQRQIVRRKTQSWLFFIVALLIISAMFIFLFRRRKANQRLKVKYDDLQEEYEALKALPFKRENIGQEAVLLLGDRVNALASFFTKKKPESLSLIAPQLNSLTEDRKELIETIGLLYAIYRPDFILKLVEKDMTPAECGYCCLIALGLRNDEVKDVINREGVNNINSALRKKLGIQSNSTKLGTVLREMFGNSEPL